MANEKLDLHTGTTVSSGAWLRCPGPTFQVQAYLNPSVGGGTGTCNLYGRMSGGPSVLLWTSKAMSGAGDHDEYVVDDERWYEIKADISAIGGGTSATIVAGV